MSKKKCKIVFVFFISSISVLTTSAQLCTGSLGDPVVDIDFGSGTSAHGSAFGSGITSYSYSSADFPIDESYTIENSTAGAGSVWWYTTYHTGNFGGYMMIVNANYSVTDSFLIYDRWGNKIFETHNLEEGWNGYFNGKLCAEGGIRL